MSREAIVIGAGPNGLAAAVRLAEAGLSVTVLEQAARPGGAVRTEELTLPGFRHDTFSAVHPAAAASPVFARMPLAAHGLEWVHPELCMAYPLPDGSAIGLHRDLNLTAASLDRHRAGDGAGWAAFTAPYLEAFDAVRNLMLAGFPPLGGAFELLRRAGVVAAGNFTRLLAGSAVALGRRLFESGGSRAWLYGAAMHGDASPPPRGQRSRASISICSATPSAGRARGAARSESRMPWLATWRASEVPYTLGSWSNGSSAGTDASPA